MALQTMHESSAELCILCWFKGSRVGLANRLRISHIYGALVRVCLRQCTRIICPISSLRTEEFDFTHDVANNCCDVVWAS